MYNLAFIIHLINHYYRSKLVECSFSILLTKQIHLIVIFVRKLLYTTKNIKT